MNAQGLYFETRHDLIMQVSKWLIANGYKSELTLNCVSQLLKRTEHSTFESDLQKLVTDMFDSKEKYRKMEKEKLFYEVKPLMEAEAGYRQCGKETKKLCYGMLFAAVESGDFTGNLKIDIQRAIEHAVMYVEHHDGKDFEKY